MAEATRTPAGAGSSRPAVVAIVLGLLVLQFMVLGLIQAWEDSFTFDEPFYMTSGSTAIREHDLRINFEHPPLPKILAAAPAELFGSVDIPLDLGAWEKADQWNLSLQTVAANQNDIQRTTFLYRIVPLLEGAAVGVLLYLLARDLFGWKAGLLAAFLWLTLPVIVGFGHLNGLDIPAALSVVLSLWLLNRYVDRSTWARLALVSGSVGIALLSRAAVGLIVAGSAFIVVLIADALRRNWMAPLRSGAVLVGGWILVWVGYLVIDPSGFDPTRLDAATRAVIESDPTSLPGRIALLVPWPAGFEAGIRFLSDLQNRPESPGFLFGIPFTGAPAWFWPGSLVFKLTPIVLVAVVAGAISWFRLPREVVMRGLLILSPTLIGLVLMMAFAQRPFGVRYLIPVIAILLLVAAPLARFATTRKTLAVFGVAAVLQLGMLWDSHPHSLAWSNPLTRESWQLAVDANVDWGQDFYRLQEWAESVESVYVSYFGFGPSYTLDEIPNAISAHPQTTRGTPQLPPAAPKWVAISASNLNAYAAGQFGLLREYCPVDRIGATILIYHFEQMPPVLLGNSWGGIPQGLCPDEEFSLRR